MERQGKLIDVQGLRQTSRLLGQVDKELRRQMFKEVGSIVKKRVTAARDAVPVRSGQLRKLTELTKAGSKKSQAVGGGSRKQGLFGFQAISAAPYATIYALMKQAQRPSTVTLLANLNASRGPVPRDLPREFLPSGEGGTQLWRESREIVEKYVTEVNKQIDQAANVRLTA